MSARDARALAARALPAVLLGLACAAGAVALAGLPAKFSAVGLATVAGMAGALAAGRHVRLTPLFTGALALGLTVKLDVSFLQHYEAAGQFLPSVGGGAGLTLSLPLLSALALLAHRLAGLEPDGRRLRLDPPLLLAQAAFMAAGLLSLVNAEDATFLVYDELRFLGLLVLFVAVSNLAARDVRGLVAALCLLCLMQTAAALAQYLTGSELGLSVLGEEGVLEDTIAFSTRTRAAGFKVHPNILGYYYEIVWPVALAAALCRGPLFLRIAGAAAALCACAGVVLTLSRAAWGTFPVSAVLVAALVYRDRLASPAARRMGAALLAGLSLAAAFVGPTIAERFLADDGGSASQRGPLNDAALKLFAEFPVLGVGLNNFGNMFATHDTTGLSRLAGLFDRSNHVVHNLHLLVLTEVGVLGYAAFAGLFLIAIRRGVGAAGRAPAGDPPASIAAGAAIGLAAHLMHGLVDPGFRLNLGIAELVFTALGLTATARAPATEGPRS